MPRGVQAVHTVYPRSVSINRSSTRRDRYPQLGPTKDITISYREFRNDSRRLR